MKYKVGDKFHGGVEVDGVREKNNMSTYSAYMNSVGEYAWVTEQLLDALGLLSEPKNGDEVWVRDGDGDWDAETRKYVGTNPISGKPVAVNEDGCAWDWDEVTTTNPHKQETIITIDGIEYSQQTIENIVRKAHK